MPRKLRRRLATPSKKKIANISTRYEIETEDFEESTPRGRLKGALKEALIPGGDESDVSVDQTPHKSRPRKRSSSSSDDDWSNRQQSPQRYVLKLFDRSVDLSQFSEDSPLYPICRAWIANKPRMNYKKFGKRKQKYEEPEDTVELSGPVGPPISRIPKLLPEQEQRSKDNINLDYQECPPPARETLLGAHVARWAAVRQAWLEQAQRVEARYHHTQQLLNKITI